MKLQIIKFGEILNSRPSGREAALRAKQIINESNTTEEISLDFSEVKVLAPSFADEFIKGLKGFYPDAEIKFDGFLDNPLIKDILTSLGFIKVV